MKIVSATAILFLAAASAGADEALDAMDKSMSDTITAREVSQIIGTADQCDYQLSETKVAQFMTDRVAEMDEMARLSFQTAGRAQKVRMKKMSQVEKTAACALQAKLAQKYDLLQ